MEEYGKKMKGKPGDGIYHKAQQIYGNAGHYRFPHLPGFVYGFACTVIARFAIKTLQCILSNYVGVGAFYFVWYVGHNWMHTPWDVLKPELMDDPYWLGLTGIC